MNSQPAGPARPPRRAPTLSPEPYETMRVSIELFIEAVGGAIAITRRAGGKVVASAATGSRRGGGYCRVEIGPEVAGVLDADADS